MDDDLRTRLAQWAAENPEGASALRAEGAAAERTRLAEEHAQALAAARAEGATAERDRVASIRSVVPPGYAALADELIASGADVNAAALAVCAQVRQEHEAAATVARTSVPPAVEFASAPAASEATGQLGSADGELRLHAAAVAYQQENPGVNYVDAIKAVSNGAI